MATVKLDIRDGSRAVKDNQGWREVERIALVHGLTGTGQQVIDNALKAPGMPSLASGGDPHPHFPALYLIEAAADAEDPKVVRVRLVYRRRQDESVPGQATSRGTITVGTTIEQRETNVDYRGAPLLVEATLSKITEPDQTGTVSIGIPKTTRHFSRIERSDPTTKSRDYVGRVNSGGWNKVEPGAKPRTWLCTGIVGHSTDGGVSFTTDYDFVRCEQVEDSLGQTVDATHDVFPFWIDPATGKPPYDVQNIDYTASLGKQGIKGWARYQTYPTADFNRLELGG